MRDINVGIVGLGNVGSGAVTILAENADEIAARLGFRLNLEAVCSRTALRRPIDRRIARAFVTEHGATWLRGRGIDIVVELIGGTGVARQVVEGANRQREKRRYGQQGTDCAGRPQYLARATERGVSLGLEASVCGGIPIHAVLREGICADRIETLFGILNGTSNYILTEIEKHGTPFNAVLAEGPETGLCRGRSGRRHRWIRRPLQAGAAGRVRFRRAPRSAADRGRGHPAHRAGRFPLRSSARLHHPPARLGPPRGRRIGSSACARLWCRSSTVLASVQGAYNGVWSRGAYGADTFYLRPGRRVAATGVAGGQRPDESGARPADRQSCRAFPRSATPR